MATAMTYSSLLNDLRNYLERGATLATDPSVYIQLPSLIGLAERRLARELKIQGTVTVVSSTMTTGEPTYPKPDRWRETVSINVGTNVGTATTFNTRVTLLPRSYEYIRTYWPDDTQTGTPKFYADYDYEHYILVPTPSETFPYEVNYWQLTPLLDSTLSTNWITEYAPNALLHGTLVEAFCYLKNTAEAATWQAAYDRDMAALAGEDMQKILDRVEVP